MKHVLVTNGKWFHNVYNIENGKEWIAKHPERKNVYIKANYQWFYKAGTHSCILEHDSPDLVVAITANLSTVLKKAGFRGDFQLSSLQLTSGKRQITMMQAILKVTVCPIMPRIMRIGNKTIVQNLVTKQKETRTIVFSNVQSNEYDGKPVCIRGITYDYKYPT